MAGDDRSSVKANQLVDELTRLMIAAAQADGCQRPQLVVYRHPSDNASMPPRLAVIDLADRRQDGPIPDGWHPVREVALRGVFMAVAGSWPRRRP